MSFHLNNTAGRQLAVWAAIAFATAGCWENSTTKTGRRGYAVTNPDECESYGMPKQRHTTSGPMLALMTAAKRKAQSHTSPCTSTVARPTIPNGASSIRRSTGATLERVQHPSNGNATEYWGLNCILVNGA